jgi:hypothetical protein
VVTIRASNPSLPAGVFGSSRNAGVARRVRSATRRRTPSGSA